jgi:NAD(P) transhydrogenase
LHSLHEVDSHLRDSSQSMPYVLHVLRDINRLTETATVRVLDQAEAFVEDGREVAALLADAGAVAADVIGFPSLASTSMEQGRVASANAFGNPTVTMPSLFPYGLYTIPEISFVGQTEEQLTKAGVPFEVGVAMYREIARGGIIGDATGRLRLIFRPDTGALLGVYIIGEGAAELVHIGQAVIALGGTVRYFVDNVFNYPTLAECYKVAALHGLNKLNAFRSSRTPAVEPALA